MSDLPVKLTKRQEAFVRAYVGEARLVGATAARLAGYSERCAPQVACQALRNPQVQCAIRYLLEQQSLGATEVTAYVSDQAKASLEDFFDIEDGKPVLNLEKAKERGRLHLVRKIRFGRDGRTVEELELHDSQKALEMLARVHGLFEDRHTLTLEQPYKVYEGFDPEAE